MNALERKLSLREKGKLIAKEKGERSIQALTNNMVDSILPLYDDTMKRF